MKWSLSLLLLGSIAACTEESDPPPQQSICDLAGGPSSFRTVCVGDRLYGCARTLENPQGESYVVASCEVGMCRDDLFTCVARLGAGLNGEDLNCPAGTSLDGVGYCEGQQIVRCEGGFAVQVSSCNVECRESGDLAECTASAPDPVCDDIGRYYRCRGDTSVECFDGYSVKETDCAASGEACEASMVACV
jgi:hypothetical protein